ncbi:fungal chitosanase of glycosyl hydrolase group 75-domain-containing protein [Auriculariales sp. MPI-PUGE-AT-0066]|nr:fungal chitosanase of glycosyl hydrolase group 75-domain-containing protein [Auriculariales sp. MPI-PUGE-AT-0066]
MVGVRTTLVALQLVTAAFASPHDNPHHHHHLGKRAVGFQASPHIDAAGIAAAARSSLNSGRNTLAAYRSTDGASNNVKIQETGCISTASQQCIGSGTWTLTVTEFITNVLETPMSTAGQKETNWGALDARTVPWIVIPQSFLDSHKKQLVPNALSAVICGSPPRMYYAIFGDTNGDSPEMIGEASLMLAQTCFPKDKLSGARGHSTLDVTYIVWGTKAPTGVGRSKIDIKALKTLGDQQATLLQNALGLQGGSVALPTSSTTQKPTSSESKPATPKPTSSKPPAPPPQPHETEPTKDMCFWDGDCPGQYCCIFKDIANRCIAKSSCSANREPRGLG